MSLRMDRLERSIVTLFEQAYNDGQSEVAEHLLRALEAIDDGHTSGGRGGSARACAEAYSLIARRS